MLLNDQDNFYKAGYTHYSNNLKKKNENSIAIYANNLLAWGQLENYKRKTLSVLSFTVWMNCMHINKFDDTIVYNKVVYAFI